MKNWYIGIDESGAFDWTNPSDKSFVCAIITQKSHNECEEFLRECANIVDPEAYRECGGEALHSYNDVLRQIIEHFYHGMDNWRTNPEFETKILRTLLENDSDIFDNMIVSQPGPQQAANEQHYYINSLYDVLNEICNRKDLFKTGDTLNIDIAERAIEVTGNVPPITIVMSQMQGNCEKLRKINPHHPDIATIGSALTSVRKYGERRVILPNGRIQNLNSYNGATEQYLVLLRKKHDVLARNVGNFLTKAFPGLIFKVRCCSARDYSLPALADQAVNIIKNKTLFPEFQIEKKIQFAKKYQQINGLNVAAYVEAGDIISAAKVFLDRFYDSGSLAQSDLDKALSMADDNEREQLWEILITHAEERMENRGDDGEIIQKTKELVELFDKLFYTYYPSRSNLAVKLLRMKGSFAAHNGNIDLDSEMESLEEINAIMEDTQNYASYQELRNLYIDQMVNGVAQVRFNNYDFDFSMYENILNQYQEEHMGKTAFFQNHPDFIDSNYAKLKGTIGQALAFNGKYEDALHEIEEDYNHSHEKNDMVASFALILNLKIGNFEKAKEWFLKETEATLNQAISFEDFSEVFNSQMDAWLGLNYLRLYAYARKHKISVEDRPPFECWDRTKAGDYPWALLLKWEAYLCILDNRNAKAKNLLDSAIYCLKKANSFTIKSLALSPLRMKMILDNNAPSTRNEYKSLLAELEKQSKSFCKYSQEHYFADENAYVDLWDALNMLPFNYS